MNKCLTSVVTMIEAILFLSLKIRHLILSSLTSSTLVWSKSKRAWSGRWEGNVIRCDGERLLEDLCVQCTCTVQWCTLSIQFCRPVSSEVSSLKSPGIVIKSCLLTARCHSVDTPHCHLITDIQIWWRSCWTRSAGSRRGSWGWRSSRLRSSLLSWV